jgi:hypothetical protein
VLVGRCVAIGLASRLVKLTGCGEEIDGAGELLSPIHLRSAATIQYCAQYQDSELRNQASSNW